VATSIAPTVPFFFRSPSTPVPLPREAIACLVNNCSPEPASAPLLPSHTVSELLDAYEREYLPGLAPRTQHSTALLYLRWKKEFGSLPLTDLTPAFLRQWRDTLSARFGPSTVNRYLASLGSALTVAVRDYEWLSTHPLHKVRKAPEPPGRVRFLSDEERHRLLSAVRLSHNPHLSTLVLLALTTGARKNEMLQLRWGDVDLERGLLRLLTTKNKQPRAVPIRGEALQLLRRQGQAQPPEAWVFPRWDRLKPVLIEQAWQTAKRRAGLENFHFHDLRHTAASYLAMSGASLLEVAEILGHKSLRQTMKYSHLTNGHIGDVVEKMVRHKLGTQQESLYGRTER
jgi:integrase